MLIVDCADYIPAPKEIKLFGLAFSISIKRLSQDIKWKVKVNGGNTTFSL